MITEPSPKIFNRGLHVCAGWFDIVKIDKTPMIYSVSYFNLGGLGTLFGGLIPAKPLPCRRDWIVISQTSQTKKRKNTNNSYSPIDVV